MTTRATIIWATLALVVVIPLYYLEVGCGRRGAITLAGISGKPAPDLYNNRHPYLLPAHKLNNEKKYDSAIALYSLVAERFYREKQWENYVWVTGYIARLYLYVAGRDFHDALPYLKKSAAAGTAHLQPTNAYLAPTYYYYGLYYSRMNADTAAIGQFHRALGVLAANALDTSLYAADNFEGIADVYFNQSFRNLEAEKYYLDAIRVREALPHPACDSDITISYYNLVTLYDYINDYDRAQYYCQKAIQHLPFIRNYRNYWEELLDGVSGNLYTKQKRNAKAIETLRNVVQLNRARHSDKVLLSFYLSSLGNIYAAMSSYDSAISYYNQSLNASHTVSIYESSELQRAATSYDLGTTLLKASRPAPALAPLAYNLRFRQKNQPGNTKEIVTACNALAQAFFLLERPDSALHYLQLGLEAYGIHQSGDSSWTAPRAAQLKNAFWSYQIIAQKALVLKSMYDDRPNERRLLVAALDYYSLADSLAQGFRNIYEGEDTKLTFNNNTDELYEDALDCAHTLWQLSQDPRYEEIILRLIESRKSSLLAQNLSEDQFVRRLPASDQERSDYRQAGEEVSFLRSQIDNRNGSQTQKDPVIDSLSARLVQAQTKYLSLQNTLAKKYAHGTATQTNIEPVRLQELSRYGASQQTMILDYFWGREAVYAVGSYGGKTAVLREPVDSALIKNLVGLRRQLAKGFTLTTEEEDFTAYQRCSWYLFQHLLAPVFAQLHAGVGGRQMINLVVSPDGQLWTIPFEALNTDSVVREQLDYGRLDYLLRHFTISYAYSAKFLIHTPEGDGNTGKARLLAFSGSRTDLPGTNAEIDSISRYYDATVYQDDRATVAGFRREAPQFDILHLAVHGAADSNNLFDSRLFFAKGELHAYELYGMPLKARLAVLSACESATGRFSNGEGVYSLSRAFMLAGCQSIVSSLWRVDDQATTHVMSGFYRDLSKGYTLSQALTGSKLAYISSADRRNAHPAKWSAFVLFGNGHSTLPPGERDGGGKIHWLIAALVILLIAGILIGRGLRKKGPS